MINNNNRITQALLNAKADPNLRDNIGRPALVIAASHNNNELITMLLAAGADPNLQQNKESKYTALMWAAYYNNKPMVEELLNAGAKLDLENSSKETALMIARRRNSNEVLGF